MNSQPIGPLKGLHRTPPLMACGCAEECCGICVHAQAAGRTRENAADWEPPDLNALRGEENREERNGEAGKPVMWFWQMTGTR